jgi:hypothetical protein
VVPITHIIATAIYGLLWSPCPKPIDNTTRINTKTKQTKHKNISARLTTSEGVMLR